VAASNPVTGKELRDQFVSDVSTLTFGLVRMRGSSMVLGPLEILRFGRPKITRTGVDWPVDGGLAARTAGGHWSISASGGRLVASLEGYAPRLPRFIYALTQLPFHHVVMRLHLLRARGRVPSPGVPAAPTRRFAAGAIDVGLCAAVALIAGRRRRLAAFAGLAIGYHVACWSSSGRTVGGLVAGQRVVSVDGSPVSIGQSLVRILLLPMALLRLRAVHDEIAGTEVISD
jgi:hypothetical protein